MTPLDVANMSLVVGAYVSPDGGHVAALIKSRPEPLSEGDGAGWTDLYVLSHQDTGAQPRPYITSQESISGVRWSPDSQALTFMARRDGDARRQLYRLELAGGEAQRLVDLRAGAKGYRIAPDGMHVAYTVSRGANNGAGALRSNGFKQEIFEEQRRNPGLVIQNITTGTAKYVELGASPSDLAWSPDGTRLAVATAPTSTVDDYYMRRNVTIVDAETRKAVGTVDVPGKMSQMAWSPDGTYIAIISGADIHDPRDGRILVAPATGGKGRILLGDFPGHVRAFAWKTATTLAFALDKGTANTLAQINVDGSGFKELMDAPEQLFYSWNLAQDGDRWAAMCDSPKHPYEVCTGRLSKGNVKRRTNSNTWMKELRLAKQESVTFKARDGLDIQGILVHPLDPVKGTAPLVLQVHGGPESHVRNGWVTSYGALGHVASARGMYVNMRAPRGSCIQAFRISKCS